VISEQDFASVCSLQGPHFSERIGRMALCAVGTEFAVMNVIELVAIRTVTTEFCVRTQWPAMTRLTRNVGVRTVQHEARLAIVIEEPLLPVNRVVAVRTVSAESAIMGVIDGVAIDALLGCVAEHV